MKTNIPTLSGILDCLQELELIYWYLMSNPPKILKVDWEFQYWTDSKMDYNEFIFGIYLIRQL